MTCVELGGGDDEAGLWGDWRVGGAVRAQGWRVRVKTSSIFAGGGACGSVGEAGARPALAGGASGALTVFEAGAAAARSGAARSLGRRARQAAGTST